MREQMIIMDQRNIKHEVQALWLQYSGLKTRAGRSGEWIENAAQVPFTPGGDLPDFPGLIIAT
jgi:hypothetical protein